MGNIVGDALNAVGDTASAVGGAVNGAINETVGAASDIVSSAIGGDTRDQARGKIDALQAQQAAEREQERLAKQQRGLEVSGSDPAAINAHDNWDSWSHQELYSFRETLKTEQMQESGQAWADLGQELSEIFADLDKEARAKAGDGMQGEAAEAGMSAARPLQDWGSSFGDAVQMNGLKVQEAGSVAQETRNAIQEPSEPSTARQIIAGGASAVTFGAAGSADAGLRMREKEEDAKRARAVAKNVFGPGYDTVDTSTAKLPPPKNPLKPPPPPPTPPPARADVSSTQDPSVSGRVSGQPSQSSTMDSMSAQTAGSVGTHPAPSAPKLMPSAPPAESGSAWMNPTPPGGAPPGVHGPGMPPGHGSSQSPGAVGMAPGVGGAATGGGAGGAARGLGAGGAGAARGGTSAGTPGAGGRAGAGAVGGRAGAPTAGPAGPAGSAGGRGAGGGGGMGAGRGQGQGGEEEEHDRPSWLEEPEDVFFNDMPKVAPPVFGA